MNAQSTDTGQQWVRVWFGQHVLADYAAEPAVADRYADAMRQRFMGLRVTSEPLPDNESEAAPLPSERMWEMTAV
ncbi:hypothetical protein [Solicola gregarius]|uniref:Uncharacterized protein n=1 Tax=Solicola gregarius TaxID=2908642 RepID=A0AA46TIP1_9ACTN|nr:hypothetical protein [Solicola gregarius]UYM05855.1 hypothetical protein L0C25_01890 [Solicola gregarius]